MASRRFPSPASAIRHCYIQNKHGYRKLQYQKLTLWWTETNHKTEQGCGNSGYFGPLPAGCLETMNHKYYFSLSAPSIFDDQILLGKKTEHMNSTVTWLSFALNGIGWNQPRIRSHHVHISLNRSICVFLSRNEIYDFQDLFLSILFNFAVSAMEIVILEHQERDETNRSHCHQSR